MSNSPDSSLRPSADDSPLSRGISRRTVNGWLGALALAPLLPYRLWFPVVEVLRQPELSEIAGARNYDIGMTVGAGEPWQEEGYLDALRKNATTVVPVSEFGQQTVDEWGTGLAKPFIQWAGFYNKTLRIRRLFENGDYGQELQNIIDNTNPDDMGGEVSFFMQRRTRGVLQTVKDSLAEIHMLPQDLNLEIVVADSALWYSEDEDFGGWAESIYDIASPGTWIADAYIYTRDAVGELGFRADTRFMYSDYGMEVPSGKGHFVRETLKGVKQEIGDRLGIEAGKVQLDVGLKGSFRDNSVDDEYAAALSQVDAGELREYLSSMAEVVGPTHYDEFQYKGSVSGMREAVGLLATTQLDLDPGVSRGITFLNPLRRDYSGCVNTLIDPDTYQPLPLRQDLVQLLSKS